MGARHPSDAWVGTNAAHPAGADPAGATASDRRDLLERIDALEQENREFADRMLELEALNDNLAALYVASSQLHRTLRLDEVLRAAMEIVINLVGAETLCIYLVNSESGVLRPIACEGKPATLFPEIRVGNGAIGQTVAEGTVAIHGHGTPDPEAPLVTIPLHHEGRPIGAIAIYEFLAQKDAVSGLDDELFALLAEHAATAIVAAQLHGRAERKLDTIQGFLDLLAE